MEELQEDISIKDISRRHFIRRLALCAMATPLTSLCYADTYVVKRGDTLSGIASSFGMSVAQLAQRNGLDADRIRAGQVLSVPSQQDEMAFVQRATENIDVHRRKWKYVVAHHSATRHGNAEIFDRAHRRRGMNNGLAYHFVIGNGRDSQDGGIEIGGRWTRQLHGGHVSTWKYNEQGIGICLVGNFEKQRPTRRQVASLKKLIAYLGEDLLDGKYTFLVHREINQTLCPGRYFPTDEMHRLFG